MIVNCKARLLSQFVYLTLLLTPIAGNAENMMFAGDMVGDSKQWSSIRQQGRLKIAVSCEKIMSRLPDCDQRYDKCMDRCLEVRNSRDDEENAQWDKPRIAERLKAVYNEYYRCMDECGEKKGRCELNNSKVIGNSNCD